MTKKTYVLPISLEKAKFDDWKQHRKMSLAPVDMVGSGLPTHRLHFSTKKAFDKVGKALSKAPRKVISFTDKNLKDITEDIENTAADVSNAAESQLGGKLSFGKVAKIAGKQGLKELNKIQKENAAEISELKRSALQGAVVSALDGNSDSFRQRIDESSRNLAQSAADKKLKQVGVKSIVDAKRRKNAAAAAAAAASSNEEEVIGAGLLAKVKNTARSQAGRAVQRHVTESAKQAIKENRRDLQKIGVQLVNQGSKVNSTSELADILSEATKKLGDVTKEAAKTQILEDLGVEQKGGAMTYDTQRNDPYTTFASHNPFKNLRGSGVGYRGHHAYRHGFKNSTGGDVTNTFASYSPWEMSGGSFRLPGRD